MPSTQYISGLSSMGVHRKSRPFRGGLSVLAGRVAPSFGYFTISVTPMRAPVARGSHDPGDQHLTVFHCFLTRPLGIRRQPTAYAARLELFGFGVLIQYREANPSR